MLTKRNPPAGARPGTLMIPDGSLPPRIRAMDFDAHDLVDHDVQDVEELARFTKTRTTTWIDIQGLGDEAVLRRVAELFEIHPLALEDAVNVPQRAKAEIYDQHAVVIGRAPLYEDETLTTPQVCFVIGHHYLITFQDRYFGFFDAVRNRLRAGNAPIRSGGPGYLAYALLDALTDHYFPVVEDLSQKLDDLEDLVLIDPEAEDLGVLHRLRREIATLRRVGWPQRETLGELVRSASPFMAEKVRVYLRDTEDHMAQIMGRVDFCREIAVGLMDMYLSTLSHRQNEIMKVLTLTASIFIPLTFIAGIYGMNFEYMPELHSPRGYFVVLGAMAVVAAALVWYFRHRGWLGSSARRRHHREEQEERRGE